jgi:hypothetical protein
MADVGGSVERTTLPRAAPWRLLLLLLLRLLYVLPLRYAMLLLLHLHHLLIPLLLVIPGLVGGILLLLVLLLMLLVLLAQLGFLPSSTHSSLHLQVRTGAACRMPTLHNVPLRMVWRRVSAVEGSRVWRAALKGRQELAA